MGHRSSYQLDSGAETLVRGDRGPVSVIFAVLLLLVSATNASAQDDAAKSDRPDSATLDSGEPRPRGDLLAEDQIALAPSPVTIITDDMIDAIGARNLREVLTTYVPGMTVVEDSNELNVAVRGLYAASQQKMLVMLDGHRLNSRAFASAPPDFSIGIDPAKVRRIEVVRGPASAKYGNVASNAVINIVTADPGEVDGVDASIGAGNYGQLDLDMTFGEQLSENHSMLVWGEFYRAAGRDVSLSSSEVFNSPISLDPPPISPNEPLRNPKARLMGFHGPPSFDTGLKYDFYDFTLLADLRQGKRVPPYSSGGNATGEAYNYQDYRTWYGVGPGLATINGHFELAFERRLAPHVQIESSLYLDHNRTQHHVVRDEASRAHSDLGWFETSFGNRTSVAFSYDTGRLGAGRLDVGYQIDAMDLVDSYWVSGGLGDFRTVSDTHIGQVDTNQIHKTPALAKGNEVVYSGFTQLQHRFGFSGDVVANLGVRYDYLDRFRNENLQGFSPRTAVIFGPSATLGAKLSYTQSFADAPYWYRHTGASNFRGARDLGPERMRAYQFAPTLRLLDGKLHNTVNLFNVEHSNAVFRTKTLDYEKPRYDDTGRFNVVGVEEELAYLRRDYRVRVNATWQRPLGQTKYPTTGAEIHNVPRFFSNVVLDARPLWFTSRDIWLSLASRYYSEQLSPYFLRFKGPLSRQGATDQTYSKPNNVVADRLILRSSLRWNELFGTNFRLQLTVDNLLNTRYYQGGSTSHPYRQPGRWYLLSVGYRHSL